MSLRPPLTFRPLKARGQLPVVVVDKGLVRVFGTPEEELSLGQPLQPVPMVGSHGPQLPTRVTQPLFGFRRLSTVSPLETTKNKLLSRVVLNYHPANPEVSNER